MERQSLIDEKQKITLADEKSGVLKVDLIQVVGRGGTAIAYKGIRHFNGEKQMCIIKEYFPDESQSPVKHYYREKAGEPKRNVRNKMSDEKFVWQMRCILMEKITVLMHFIRNF